MGVLVSKRPRHRSTARVASVTGTSASDIYGDMNNGKTSQFNSAYGIAKSTSESPLDIQKLLPDPRIEPMVLFKQWFEEAQFNDNIRLATSMVLATTDRDGRPTCRIVGVKGFDDSGFHILTNRNSRKALDLADNPFASLMFYWEPMDRMIRIETRAHVLPVKMALKMWRCLPRSAQIIHAASHQDEVIEDRQVFMDRKKVLEDSYGEEDDIEMNPEWCAFNLVADRFEFFQTTPEMPDRIVYRKSPGHVDSQNTSEWKIEVISP